jgi:DNA invertase Pin-like site-specific DNA recombinase
MKKTKPTVAIYFRTNHLNNMAPLHNLEAYASENEFAPIIFLDVKNGVENRPSLNNLLNLVQNKQLDIIITNSLTRFARKTCELAAILREFQKYNVKVILPSDREGNAHHE